MQSVHRAAELEAGEASLASAVERRQAQRKLSLVTHSLKGGARTPPIPAQVLTLVCLFFFFSSFSSILNKSLSSPSVGFHSTTVSFIEVSFNVAADTILLTTGVTGSRWELPWSFGDMTRRLGPIAVCSVLARLFTLLGYGTVSVALAHTIKALMPLFSLSLDWLLLKKVYPMGVYLSVVPIVIGVVLSAASDSEFNAVGLLCAALSTLCSTLMNFLMKQRMMDGMDKLNIHFSNALISSVMLLPPFALTEYSAPSSWPVRGILTLLAASTAGFLSSVMSIYTVSLVSTLSYAVIANLKRVYVIIFAVWFFHKPFSAANAFGVVLSLSGAVSYNLFNLYLAGELPFSRRGDVDRDK